LVRVAGGGRTGVRVGQLRIRATEGGANKLLGRFWISLRSGKGYSFQRENGGAIVSVFAGGVTFHLIVFLEYLVHELLTSLFPCSKALFCLSCNLEEYAMFGEPSDAQLPSSIAVTIRDAFAEQGDPAWRTGVLSESDPFLLHQPGEVFERPVIGSLGVSREAASRKFAAFQMILQAFAADALSRAGFITAIAVLQVVLFVTLHRALRSCRPW